MLIGFILLGKSILDAQRAYYHFQRRNAIERIQNYIITNLILVFLSAGVFIYGAAPQIINELSTQPIANAKPAKVIPELRPTRAIASTSQQSSDNSTLTQRANAPTARTITGEEIAALAPEEIIPILPDSFSKLKPESQLNDDAKVAELTFSSDINDAYLPVQPSEEFTEGSISTVYATFDYRSLENGNTWAWIWRQDGEIIGGGEKHWDYGNNGPGYVFMSPTTGIDKGDYSLEMWLNGELVAENSFEVTNSFAR